MRSLTFLAFVLMALSCPAARGDDDSEANSPSNADSALLAYLSIPNGSVISRLNLTQPFKTKSRWELAIAQEPEITSQEDQGEDLPGLLHFCLIHNANLDCSESKFKVSYKFETDAFLRNLLLFRALGNVAIVFPEGNSNEPLLLLTARSAPGGDGGQFLGTFLLAYCPRSDQFEEIFFDGEGTNNNQETRYVESGPLRGDVISAYPTLNAPFSYWINVFQLSRPYRYRPILRYRGTTGYGDGNQLAAIDSEMPEIERRLGLWRHGQALPIPARMPSGCRTLELRKHVEWCR